MLKTLVLLATSQLSGLALWTDDQGVVHVAPKADAPAGAQPLEGGAYSVIDADGRPKTMPDGGSRTADAAAWRARFKSARASLEMSRDLEQTAELAARPSVSCVVVTAKASAKVHVRSNQPAVVASRTSMGQQVFAVPAGARVLVADSDEQRVQRCEEQRAPALALELLAQRRRAREQAEQDLGALEQQARAAGVPLREWR